MQASLPIRGSLQFASAASFAIAVLMAVAFAVGLLRPASDGLLRASLPTDVVNLLGLPVLLYSMWLARRGSLAGLLLWPGALFYLLYHDIAYLFGMPLSVMLLLHLVLAALNLYAVIGLVASINATAVQRLLTDAVPAKVGGAVLAGFGILFFAWATAVIVNALLKHMTVAAPDFALHVTDFLMTPAWIISGVLLWRRKPLGYVTGLGLLFQACMLFLGLIVLFMLQPFLTGARFRLNDALVIFAMSLVCVIPFGLFVRGAALKHSDCL